MTIIFATLQIHRLCNTGVTQAEYRQLTARLNAGDDFEWSDYKCTETRATIFEILRQPIVDGKRLQATRVITMFNI